ncbi:ubiquitin carboxyl-terminal hydrolase 45-like isoform X5 [Anopheles aquasalis]|uniref:ubiquitin carboxyl-terminal hydrolase 45-like isoform X5 n=1 Tax=Anopheles aquasalis TaxID=42839 RepID=UPI00215B6345|nr:ubiquitin carboxyl-terminal hydrolase 45-like isoform X5 [Anopheles aquasalis]XP_050086246.1 ubiquitin carboxyl-terminal hydrolase 45-like isoform X5 [Anopheles aquasalis]
MTQLYGDSTPVSLADDVAATTIECPHVQPGIDLVTIVKRTKAPGFPAVHCTMCIGDSAAPDSSVSSPPPPLWLCLKCATELCGRAGNQHALLHHRNTGELHSLAINTTTYEVWCYCCDDWVKPRPESQVAIVVKLMKQVTAEDGPTNNSQGAPDAELEPKTRSNETTGVTNSYGYPSRDGSNILDSQQPRLPVVRGLTNLGNTCFFNAVLQCLAQTPYLLPILQQSTIKDEQKIVRVPGGVLQLPNGGPELLLPPIEGALDTSRTLTQTFANQLAEMTSGRGVGVLTPKRLLNELANRWPQFGDGDQHDSHELLRHLLESVRSDDLRRYQSLILQSLGELRELTPGQRNADVEAYRAKVKYYGDQIAQWAFLPDHVFRGSLVSTLTCQDCYGTSSQHEYFMDISLSLCAPSTSIPVSLMSVAPINRTARDDTVEPPDDDATNDEDPTSSADNLVCSVGMSAERAAQMAEQVAHRRSIDETSSPDTTATEMPLVEGCAAPGKRRQRTYSHADWSNTIAPRYQCEDGEQSVQSCLNNFTTVELMSGLNQVCCDSCTKRQNTGKEVRTNATKQYLISVPPAVLILHLKRFEAGMYGMLRKLATPVTFPFVLDIAPFCGSKVKRATHIRPGQKRILYSLYGIVEHSGSMYGGHYVAYVKVRPPFGPDDERWKFIPQGSKDELDRRSEHEMAREQARRMGVATAAGVTSTTTIATHQRDSDDSSSGDDDPSEVQQQRHRLDDFAATNSGSNPGTLPGTTDTPTAPPGKWYYVSDSYVREVTEENVLKVQAYLLFYERMF